MCLTAGPLPDAVERALDLAGAAPHRCERVSAGKAKIVVASRTQHFKSQAQVLTALGEKVGVLPHRRVLGLEEFAPAQE